MVLGDLWLGSWFRFIIGNRLAPYVPTPLAIGQRMLDLARVNQDDVCYDLGCGDGRLLVAAAQKYGCKGVGIELNAELVKMANEAIIAESVGHLVSVRVQNALDVDVSPATVVLLYLSERGNLALLPKLQEQLVPEARVVSFSFGIKGLSPTKTALVDGIGLHLYEGIGQRTTKLA